MDMFGLVHAVSAKVKSTYSEPADIIKLKDNILKGEIYKCECGGPVKPDVILFGENLPGHFHTEVNKITEADLVIVSGTSLKVYPFAFLVQMIPKTVPIVVVNFDNPIQKVFDNFLFMQGDIEAHFTKLSEELGLTN